jgi:hypothetical protein
MSRRTHLGGTYILDFTPDLGHDCAGGETWAQRNMSSLGESNVILGRPEKSGEHGRHSCCVWLFAEPLLDFQGSYLTTHTLQFCAVPRAAICVRSREVHRRIKGSNV